MPAPSFTAADFVGALQGLLPRGRAWPRDTSSTQAQVLAGLAPVVKENGDRAADLLVDAFPATAYELLPEWEYTLGLPNIYSATVTTIEGRQAQVVAALTDTGGQSVNYFVQLAALLGFTITITHFRPRSVRDPVNVPLWGKDWAHAWQINVQLYNSVELDTLSDVETPLVVWSALPQHQRAIFNVTSTVTQPLVSWNTSTLEAVIQRYKPAHTIPLFTYS